MIEIQRWKSKDETARVLAAPSPHSVRSSVNSEVLPGYNKSKGALYFKRKKISFGLRKTVCKRKRSPDPQRGARAASFLLSQVAAQPWRDGFCGRRGCSLISLNYLLFSARSQMSSYFFACLLVLWKQRKSEADLITFCCSWEPAKVQAAWVSHVCGAVRSVVLQQEYCVLRELCSLCPCCQPWFNNSCIPYCLTTYNLKPSQGGICSNLCVLSGAGNVTARHRGTVPAPASAGFLFTLEAGA